MTPTHRLALAAALLSALFLPTLALASADPMCRKLPEDFEGNDVRMLPWPVTVSTWNGREYVQLGETVSKALAQAKGDFEADHDFTISVHAANVYGGKHDPATDPLLPPVFFGSTFGNVYYKIDNVEFSDINTQNQTSGRVSKYAYGLAPSGMFDIEDENGTLTGHLVAGGNPFLMNQDPDDPDDPAIIFKGSVAFLPADQAGSCPMVFPSEDIDERGKVTNTVYCHMESGVCFFSVWKFFDPANVRDPDCLWYCIPDDIHHPTTCIHTDIVPYPDGSDICMTPIVEDTHYGGGVHGFALGNTHADGSYDLILIFTGGPNVEGPGGVSSMKKITVRRDGDSITTLKSDYFGRQLWEDTVELPYDAGLDHAWVEASGKRFWVSSFRDANPGLHLVDYNTGDLLLSIHGFDGSVPDQYTYPAGVSGFGAAGQPGSFLVLTTSTLRGLLPPEPDPCTVRFECGTGVVYLIDISDLPLPGPRYDFPIA